MDHSLPRRHHATPIDEAGGDPKHLRKEIAMAVQPDTVTVYTTTT
jgi:hypothetical protein